MLKKMRIRVIFIFAILTIAVVIAVGGTAIYRINFIHNQIINSPNELKGQVLIELNRTVSQLKIISLICFGAAGIVGVAFSFTVIRPLSNLLDSATDIVRKHNKNAANITDASELFNAMDTMNNELEENLNEVTRQKKQIETILLHMTDGIIAFNIDGTVIHINHAAKTLLDIQENDDSFEKIFNHFDVDINLEKIIYLDAWATTEKRIDVEDKTLNLIFAPFKDQNDKANGIIVVIQDITEHVKLDSMRKEFVANVSHELKTPITSIMGYAETMSENELDEETEKKFLARINSEGERMYKLVQDLLTLSKFDTSKVKLEKTEFDLGELTKYVFDGLKIEMEKKNLTGECFVTADVPYVYADKSGIERVIINILTNAIKYTKDGGNVKVYVGFVYNDAYIKIIDNGIGISKDDLNRIFDRFYRVDKSRVRETGISGGSGLGLSIAKEIIDQNKGRIDIKSELGKGTEVLIRIHTKISVDKYKTVEESTNEEGK